MSKDLLLNNLIFPSNPESVPFDITSTDLQSMLSPENISSFKSHSTLDEIGGIKSLCNSLKVNPRTGITSEDNSQDRITHFGQFKTELNLPQTKNFLNCFFDFLYQKIFVFLIIIATFKMIYNQIYQKERYFDFISLYVIVTVISLLSSFANFLFEKLFREYKLQISDKDIRVMRDNTEKIVKRSQLMVGDILIISSGDIMVVDGIVIKTYTLSIENSFGQFQKFENINYLVNEDLKDFPFLLYGTKIIKGYAMMLVLNVECYDGERCLYKQILEHANLNNHYIKTQNENDDNNDNNDASYININKSLVDTSIKKERKYTLNESLLYQDYAKAENQARNTELNNNNTNTNEINNIINMQSIYNMQHTIQTSFYNTFTPIKYHLSNLYYSYFYYGSIASFIISILLLYSHYNNPHNLPSQNAKKFSFKDINYFSLSLDTLFYFFIILITVLPCGAELSYSIPLILSMYKLLQKKTVIKSNSAFEFMAGINCICFDYYGIITKNKIKVDNIFIEGTQIQSYQLSNIRELISNEMFEFFCESISVNTVAFTAVKDNDIKYFGNNIECCLIQYLNSIKVNYQNYRNNYHRPILSTSPYISESNFAYTIIAMEDKAEYVRVYVRGSPNYLLDKISYYLSPGNMLDVFDSVQVDKMRIKCNIMEENFIQPIIICYRDINKDIFNEMDMNHIRTNVIKELNFICMIGVKDDINEDINAFVEDIQKAGINLKLVTNLNTRNGALISNKINLINKQKVQEDDVLLFEPSFTLNNDNSILKFINDNPPSPRKHKHKHNHNIKHKKSLNFNKPISDKVIDAVDDLTKYISVYYNTKTNLFTFTITNFEKFTSTLDNTAVIGNASSKDKFILVSALRKHGTCVAIIGDGISDSIPMKAAHVGISMCKNANDISKESANVLLLDNNISTLIDLISYGRSIYENVRRFLLFELSFSSSLLCLMFILSTPWIFLELELNQLLYITFIINVIEAFAFGTLHIRNEYVMNRESHEYSWSRGLIRRNLKMKIIIQCVVLFCIYVVHIYCCYLFIDDSIVNGVNIEHLKNSMLFTTVLYAIVFNAFVSKADEGEDFIDVKNWLFIILQVVIACMHVVIEYLWGKKLLRVMSLSFKENIICIFFASLSLIQIPAFRYLENNDIIFKEGEEENEGNVDWFDKDDGDSLKYIHIEIKDKDKGVNERNRIIDGDEEVSLLEYGNQYDKKEMDDLFI